jgi:hypothetical protein
LLDAEHTVTHEQTTPIGLPEFENLVEFRLPKMSMTSHGDTLALGD